MMLLYNDKPLDLGNYCHGVSDSLCDFESFKAKIMLDTHENMKSVCKSRIETSIFNFGFLSDHGTYIKNSGFGSIAVIIVFVLIILGLGAWWCYRRANNYETRLNS